MFLNKIKKVITILIIIFDVNFYRKISDKLINIKDSFLDIIII